MIFSFILYECLTVFYWNIRDIREVFPRLMNIPVNRLQKRIPNFLDCAIAILKLSIFSLKDQSVFHILQKTPLSCRQSVWGVACKKLNCICLSFSGCQKFYWFVYWNHVSQILGRSCLCWSNSTCQIGGLQQCRMGSHQFWWPRRRYQLWAKIISSHCFSFTGSQYRA